MEKLNIMESKYSLLELGLPILAFIIIFITIMSLIFSRRLSNKISAYGRQHRALSDIEEEFKTVVADNDSHIVSLTSQRSSLSESIKTLRQNMDECNKQIEALEREKTEIAEDVQSRRPVYDKLMKSLSDLETQRDTLRSQNTEVIRHIENKDRLSREVSALNISQAQIKQSSGLLTKELEALKNELNETRRVLDLYSQQHDFAEHGHYEIPEYLYESSERYKHQIKNERSLQKSLVSKNQAVLNLSGPSSLGEDVEAVLPQSKLMIRTFNIECDLLFGKVKHSNYSRTVGRVESLANSLEKQLTDLSVGFNIEYIESKLRECTLIYHEKLISKDEQEKQKLHRAELAEEAKAQREYKAALKKAQQEEETYNTLLEKARAELSLASNEDMASQQERISYLEQKLAEAKDQEERAKSMAQLTKCGYIYVISNPGSFGEGVYKIGLTRRLDPLDRVKELGDASVPFPFDIHGIIFSQDAPNLESALHREFTGSRVNVVNHRKEFFKVDLKTIENKINNLIDDTIELTQGTGHDGDYEEAIRMRNSVLESIS